MAPAVSQAQQRFMGMVHAKKHGAKGMSSAVNKAAALMSDKSAKDFASTKAKGLPEHVMSAMKDKLKKKVKK
jgi:hypothetical protein